MAEAPKEVSATQAVFEDMVKAGWEPIKLYIEYKHLEDKITDEDIALITQNIEQNLCSWVRWLRHVKKQRSQE
jgi:hypothetical protein